MIVTHTGYRSKHSRPNDKHRCGRTSNKTLHQINGATVQGKYYAWNFITFTNWWTVCGKSSIRFILLINFPIHGIAIWHLSSGTQGTVAKSFVLTFCRNCLDTDEVEIFTIFFAIIGVSWNNTTVLYTTLLRNTPDSKFPVAHMGPTRVLSAPDGPHVGPMNLDIRDPTDGVAY